MEANSFRLKKPFLVWAIGCCFIIAGPGNLAMALFFRQVENWYQPMLWFDLFARLRLPDQAVCIAGPIAGISLLIQRKRSWLFAVAVAAGACLQNLYSQYFVEGQSVYPLWVPLSTNAALLVVFYYFRYPYLDRRDRIFRGVSKRFAIALAVQIGKIEGVMTEQLSSEGCSLKFPSHEPLPAVNSEIQIQLDGILLNCLVRSHRKNTCGVRFVSPRRLSRAQMRRLMAQSAPMKTERKAS